MMRQLTIDRAALTYSYDLSLAGAVCRISTNSLALEKSLPMEIVTKPHEIAGEFSMQVLVTRDGSSETRSPHFRGLHHLVVATFGPGNVFIFDLARRNISASICEEIASNQAFWRTTLLPIALGVLGAAVGVVPIHSACLSLNGVGILIGGTSGAGKSTLSVALAKDGFDFITDDWTYLARTNVGLLAHGLSIPAKLLPDAATYFPELSAYPIQMALNQELAYELPVQNIGAAIRRSCTPRFFFLLERSHRQGCDFLPMPASEARAYIDRSIELLPLQLQDQIHTRSAIIDRVLDLSCWRLTYGGRPETAVSGLREFLALQPEGVLA